MKNFRIIRSELEEFRGSLPRHLRNEQFRWLNANYDVVGALFIIHKLSMEAIDLDVTSWCKMLGMDDEKQISCTAVHFLTGVRDVDALDDSINLDFPIVVVEHTWGKGKEKGKQPLVIDGNKRLRKAFLEGQKTIKGYFLRAILAKHFRE